MIELSIIIVNWHSADYVLNCIRSIRQQTHSMEYEIIVVDNASYDGCGEKLAERYPDTRFIQNAQNLGFARANNLGAAQAEGAVLLFLNPDTEILNQAIDLLYQNIMMLSDPGAVGCKLLNTDNSLQTSCVQALPTILNQVFDAEALRRLFPKAQLWGAAALFGTSNGIAEVEAISGACIMIKREAFEEIGGFSSEYFMYGEDIDLCFKTLRHGFRNYFIDVAQIVHHGGGSSQQIRSNFANIMMRESISRFLRRSRGRLYCSCYRLSLSVTAIVRLALLGILLPAWLVRHKRGAWAATFEKWVVILRWGFGLEQWTRSYRRLETGAPGFPDEKAS